MRTVMAGLVLGLALGCGGLMGYGEEQARLSVTPGTPWSVTYSPKKAEPHQVWIDYDVTHMGGDYAVLGDIVATPDSGTATTWQMNLTEGDSPVKGPRLTLNTSSSNFNGQGSARGTIWAVEIPAHPVGTTVTVSGTWVPNPNTQIRAVEVIVTD